MGDVVTRALAAALSGDDSVIAPHRPDPDPWDMISDLREMVSYELKSYPGEDALRIIHKILDIINGQ